MDTESTPYLSGHSVMSDKFCVDTNIVPLPAHAITRWYLQASLGQ